MNVELLLISEVNYHDSSFQLLRWATVELFAYWYPSSQEGFKGGLLRQTGVCGHLHCTASDC